MTADSKPPELDYAFLASWAGIQADGTLTAVGMSFLRVRQVATTPMAVAGRIRLFKDSQPAPLAIRIATPSGPAVEIVDEVAPSEDEATRYGDDRQQLLFVLNTHVQTAQLGKYDVQISLNDQIVRTLSFEVVALPTSLGSSFANTPGTGSGSAGSPRSRYARSWKRPCRQPSTPTRSA
jgi:hypothetical protein